MAKTHPTVIAIGPNRGHPVTKFKPAGKGIQKTRPVSRKAKLGKRVKLIRQVINEVGGVCSYEKRVIEYLKAGSMKDTKRALKTAKKALGTHRRAKLKRESLMALLRAQQAHAKAKK
jgi:large subunit ribosomal protein L36e